MRWRFLSTEKTIKRWSIPLVSLLLSPAGLGQEITIDAALIEARHGKLRTTIKGQGQLKELLRLQKFLLAQLLHNVGIDLAELPPYLQATLAQTQVRSLKALETFGAALEAMDAGHFDRAKALLAQTLRFDPNFQLARTLNRRLPALNFGGQSTQQIMARIARQTAPQSRILAEALASGGLANLVLTTLSSSQPLEPIPETPPLDSQFQQTSTEQALQDARYSEESEAARQVRAQQNQTTSTRSVGLYSVFLAWRPIGGLGAFQESPYPFLTPRPVALNAPFEVPQLGSGGYLRYSLTSPLLLTAFSEGQTGESANGLARDHWRGVHHAGAYYSLIHYETFPFQGQSSEFAYFYDWLWGVEGGATSAQAIADLTQRNAVFTYQGVAGADLTGWSSQGQWLQYCTACGSFSATLDFGRLEVRNFQISVDLGAGGPALSISAPQVPLRSDGSFAFDQAQASMTLRAPGAATPQPADQGHVAGQTFGPNAEEVGGVFAVRRGTAPNPGSIHAVGHFGGKR